MKIWAEKTTICIKVNPYYTYYAKLCGIGKFGDSPDKDTMWGWVEHLKTKVWWTTEIQRSFIELATIMFPNE